MSHHAAVAAVAYVPNPPVASVADDPTALAP